MAKKRTIRKSLSVITPGLILAFGLFLGASQAQATINPVVTETGKISLSVDGLGTNNPSGVIDVLKPSAGATVRRAAFACSTFGRFIGSGDVSIDGVGITFPLSDTASFLRSFFADVTAVVSGSATTLTGLIPYLTDTLPKGRPGVGACEPIDYWF